MNRSLHTARRQMLDKLSTTMKAPSPIRFVGPVQNRPLTVRDQAKIRQRILSEPYPRMGLLRRILRLFNL